MFLLSGIYERRFFFGTAVSYHFVCPGGYLKNNFYAKYETRARVGWIRISHLKKPFRVWENGDSLKIFNFWDVKKL